MGWGENPLNPAHGVALITIIYSTLYKKPNGIEFR